MAVFIQPDGQLRWKITEASHSAAELCWTCGSCDFECPVNVAVSRLRPQKVVRMANLGLLDELLHMPEIWYCLTCLRCMNVCPNAVSPSTLIGYLRRDALIRGIVSMETFRQYQDFFTKFQRVRWHAVNLCFKDNLTTLSDRMWQKWLEQPVRFSSSVIKPQAPIRFAKDVKAMMLSTRTTACFTCGECCSACPIVCDQPVFNPRTVFRMVNLGMLNELMHTPSIWLCIACGRCTESCSQLVDGRQIIERVKEMAIQRGIVDAGFHLRVEQANQIIFRHFIDEVDKLLNHRVMFRTP